MRLPLFIQRVRRDNASSPTLDHEGTLMIVSSHMSAHPITLRLDTDYKTALQVMKTHAIHHLPVLDGNDRLAGIVAERDLLIAAMQYSQATVDVGEVMHRDVVTVRANAPITHAASLMVKHSIGGLPVVDGDGRVVGVITETDVFRAFVTVLESKTARDEHTDSAPASPRRGAQVAAPEPPRAAARPRASRRGATAAKR